jgi:hypothetical protein
MIKQTNTRVANKLGEQDKGDVIKFYCNDSAGILFKIAETTFENTGAFFESAEPYMELQESCLNAQKQFLIVQKPRLKVQESCSIVQKPRLNVQKSCLNTQESYFQRRSLICNARAMSYALKKYGTM